MTPDEALRLAAGVGIDVRGAAARPLAGGFSNESWRVDAPAARVVVRRYGRLHLSEAAVVFEHAVMRHAQRALVEVRAPLPDGEGRTIGRQGGAFVAVVPWIDGETGRRDLAAGCAAAELLARFHRAVAGLHVRSGMRSSRFLGTLPLLHATFKDWAADGSPFARRLPWDPLIVALSGAILRLSSLTARLPVGIVHGDPHPGNVVSRGVRACGLIDFDFAQETERVYDLGAFLDEFARDDDDGELRLARIPALVAAYAAEAPLTGAERRALPDAMLRHAAFLTWYVASRHGERAPGDVGNAPRYAARVREIVRVAEAIRDAA